MSSSMILSSGLIGAPENRINTLISVCADALGLRFFLLSIRTGNPAPVNIGEKGIGVVKKSSPVRFRLSTRSARNSSDLQPTSYYKPDTFDRSWVM